jgi:hypothetical protein
MPTAVAQALAALLALYVLAGIVFAIPFVLVGAPRLDANARGAPWGFRIMILPGCAALWPVLALRWLRAERAP